MYVNYYATHGNHDLYIIWDKDKVKKVIDIGGIPYGTDPDDQDTEIGIPTTIYDFKEPVSLEELF